MAKKTPGEQKTRSQRGGEKFSPTDPDGTPKLQSKDPTSRTKLRPKRSAPNKGTPTISKKPDPNKLPAFGGSADPSDEAIRMRAYFLGERRRHLSLPGDSDSDWLEAKRQLIEEARGDR